MHVGTNVILHLNPSISLNYILYATRLVSVPLFRYYQVYTTSIQFHDMLSYQSWLNYSHKLWIIEQKCTKRKEKKVKYWKMILLSSFLFTYISSCVRVLCRAQRAHHGSSSLPSVSWCGSGGTRCRLLLPFGASWRGSPRNSWMRVSGW